MTVYYNEIEPAAAHVLEHLIKDGVIADGVVDRRSIADVEPADLKGFTQAHFFAGGGLWSVAARLAGWPDERELWTGSCPCQPFSVAGKGAGENDPRHLWPHFFRLICACRPAVVVGEQVAGKAGYGWFDGVVADLEGEGYASRAVDIPACAVNAPHIRQRLYWCAVGDADAMRELQPQGFVSQQRGWAGDASGGDMAHTECDGRQGSWPLGEPVHSTAGCDGQANQSVNAGAGFWGDAEWLTGADGKARRAKPGIRLLVDGLPGRVGLLRIGGNAIVPQVAAAVIESLMEASHG